jgi:hypothetical protein
MEKLVIIGYHSCRRILMEVMKPRIGRIVIYHFYKNYRALENSNEVNAPAIITKVHSDTRVNLRVFTDSEALLWKTSVAYGEGENQWSWPDKI